MEARESRLMNAVSQVHAYKDTSFTRSAHMRTTHLGRSVVRVFFSINGLRGLSVVTFQNPSKLAPATNTSSSPRGKIDVENRVVSTDAIMRAILMIVIQPHAKNVVKLSLTEADEVV